MPGSTHPRPKLLRQINERSVVRMLQREGPCSRADMTRRLGVTAPTVSKAVSSLLEGRLVEEIDAKQDGLGRPAKQLRLATKTAQVIGLVIDAGECRIGSAGLNGERRQGSFTTFKTPKTYRELIAKISRLAGDLIETEDVQTLGLGISMPGLIDYRQQKSILSPNVPITNGRSPALDLSDRLGIDCVMLQESHALCIAEWHYGSNRGLNDFAMLDLGAGLGLGVMTNGRLLTGNSGLAGEIGHIPRVEDGRQCGCGKRGCLETVATDAALARSVSERIGWDVGIEQLVELVGSGEVSIEPELDSVVSHLSFAVSMVISLFNPATVYLTGRLFDLDDTILGRLREAVVASTLKPAAADCHVVQTKASKSQGAVAGIIEYLTDSLAPGMEGLFGGLQPEMAPA